MAVCATGPKLLCPLVNDCCVLQLLSFSSYEQVKFARVAGVKRGSGLQNVEHWAARYTLYNGFV